MEKKTENEVETGLAEVDGLIITSCLYHVEVYSRYPISLPYKETRTFKIVCFQASRSICVIHKVGPG